MSLLPQRASSRQAAQAQQAAQLPPQADGAAAVAAAPLAPAPPARHHCHNTRRKRGEPLATAAATQDASAAPVTACQQAVPQPAAAAPHPPPQGAEAVLPCARLRQSSRPAAPARAGARKSDPEPHAAAAVTPASPRRGRAPQPTNGVAAAPHPPSTGQQPPSAAAAPQSSGDAGAAAAVESGSSTGASAVPPHAHDTRQAQRRREQRVHRRVSFAPGPWAAKFATGDGHPDHEGQLARQRRSAGMGWGRDLTPSAVRAVEAELGEDCRPSIDRLKRRVGLLPLRKRPAEYYLIVNGGESGGVGPAAAPGGACVAVAGSSGGDATGKQPRVAAAASLACQPRQAMSLQQQQEQQQPSMSPADAAPDGKAGRQLPAKPRRQRDVARNSPAVVLAAATAAQPDVAALNRKRSQPDATPGSPQLQQKGADSSSQGSPAKRASQRLGGLSNPVGSSLLGTFAKR